VFRRKGVEYRSSRDEEGWKEGRKEGRKEGKVGGGSSHISAFQVLAQS